MDTNDPILGSQAAADYLGGVTRKWLLLQARKGRLQPTKISSRVVGFRLSELNRFAADAHKQASA